MPDLVTAMDEEHQLRRPRRGLLLTGIAALPGRDRTANSRPLAIHALQPKQDRDGDTAAAALVARPDYRRPARRRSVHGGRVCARRAGVGHKLRKTRWAVSRH